MEIGDLDKTETNREVVKNFLYDVMQGNHPEKTPDYFDGDTILLVEWSENVTGALPEDRITVDIRRGEAEDDRVITIEGGNL